MIPSECLHERIYRRRPGLPPNEIANDPMPCQECRAERAEAEVARLVDLLAKAVEPTGSPQERLALANERQLSGEVASLRTQAGLVLHRDMDLLDRLCDDAGVHRFTFLRADLMEMASAALPGDGGRCLGHGLWNCDYCMTHDLSDGNPDGGATIPEPCARCNASSVEAAIAAGLHTCGGGA